MARSLKALCLPLALLVIANLEPVRTAFGDFVVNRVEAWKHPKSPEIIARIQSSTPLCRFQHWPGPPVAKPISELPQYVVAPSGSVTLFADCYQSSNDLPDKFARGVPLYFINRTGKEIRVLHQDGDLFVKLEALQPDGKWVRCEPHNYSGCGNSYDPMSPLKDEHFYATIGYRPRSGRPARMRYALHTTRARLTSNEFEGWYSSDDLEMARFDSMAFKEAGLEFLEDFLVCREQPSLLSMDYAELRHIAARTVESGRFGADEAWSVVSHVRRFDPASKLFENVTLSSLDARHKSYEKLANEFCY